MSKSNPTLSLEHDSCAIIARVKKDGQATHGNVKRTLDALDRMGHRTGEVEQEGDGAGIQTDVPKLVWGKWLEQAHLNSAVAANPYFTVGHFMIAKHARANSAQILERLKSIICEHGFEVVHLRMNEVRSNVLGRLAKETEPIFVQFACVPADYGISSDGDSFKAGLAIEKQLPDVHVVSFSKNSVIYKVRGEASTLWRYYPELMNNDYHSAISLAHGRFSTNTNSIFQRVQMFSTLGHNGEINTNNRLRREAKMLGFSMPQNASDSQNLDRIVESFMFQYDFSLMETMELLFPPVWHEFQQYPKQVQQVYLFGRRVFGLLAQGPAAIIARQGDEIVFSVDALGLRPLWFCETEKEYIASSEKGVVDFHSLEKDPKPLAPGEKMAIRLDRAATNSIETFYSEQKVGARLFSHTQIQQLVGKRFTERLDGFSASTNLRHASMALLYGKASETKPLPESHYAAFGWQRGDVESIKVQMESGREVIGSTGYDGPLAILVDDLQNLSDYFKERVAVVTNPAIDKDREGTHFSLRTFLGGKPLLQCHAKSNGCTDNNDMPGQIMLQIPVLLDSGFDGDEQAMQATARKFGTLTVSELFSSENQVDAAFDSDSECGGGFMNPNMTHEQVVVVSEAGSPHVAQLGAAPQQVLTLSSEDSSTQAIKRFDLQSTGEASVASPHAFIIDLTFSKSVTLRGALDELCTQVEKIARTHRSSIILLDDRQAFSKGHEFLVDGVLAVAVVSRHLEQLFEQNGSSLRRRTSIVLCSGVLRNVHDIMVVLGLGADAVAPYMMLRRLHHFEKERTESAENLVKSLRNGIEKVMSTMGIHEIYGYGKLFASIGFSKELAALFRIKNELESDGAGKSMTDVENDAHRRFEIYGRELNRTPVENRFYPKIWKLAEDVAQGEKKYTDLVEKLKIQEEKTPVALRHTWDLQPATKVVPSEKVEIGIDGLSAPFYISAMSFGSQGETAYRAYAQAAARLNILCMNGEGGELEDMLGKFSLTRGQQVASGRFGVNARLLNSAKYLEIKVGQGAKPGEGGQLPGFKVTAQIAQARHTVPNTELISPSNNHDIYSIEDLAQLIEELKTINPDAKISVKIPAVAHLAPIVTGIAKAGTDIISISGYDGGTGAARKHALRHVGYPIEIGVREAHRALIEAGLRNRVEVWADGGMKSVDDILKMMAVGANRIGFGTLAMIAVGCTICRDCHLGTCHVGITAHFQSESEALKFGLKKYKPRELGLSVDRLCTLFGMMQIALKERAGMLGLSNLIELVGNTNYLVQKRELDKVDCTELLALLNGNSWREHKPRNPLRKKIRRPMTSLTRMISNSIAKEIARGYREIIYEDEDVTNVDRAIGTHLSGMMARKEFTNEQNGNQADESVQAYLRFKGNHVPGNGLGAFNTTGVHILVRGGAQDGTAKCANGGTVTILKGENHDGIFVDGSVGKCFAYGAQSGTFVVQGNADSRAGIRLSGADLIIGGRPAKSLNDLSGNLANHANIKGFAFEYMTSGRVLILGDPGPWMCSGMSGGIIYFRLDEKVGLTREALNRRIAPGSRVSIKKISRKDEGSIIGLLEIYLEALQQSHQHDEIEFIEALIGDVLTSFVKGEPSRAAK